MGGYAGEGEDSVDIHLDVLKLVRLEQRPAPFLERFFLALHCLPPKSTAAAPVRVPVKASGVNP